MKLILASGSPRRKEMLEWLDLDFEVIPGAFDEDSIQTDDVEDLVEELALQKALTVFRQHPEAIVLGADSVVSLDDHIIGKPKDREDCRRIIRLLSGTRHQIYTGVAVLSEQEREVFSVISDIEFRQISGEEIEEYLDLPVWRDKAGGYAIQEDPGKFVVGYDGSFTNIIGLPLVHVAYELKRLGILVPEDLVEITESKTGHREQSSV